jgi:hypothetical protein
MNSIGSRARTAVLIIFQESQRQIQKREGFGFQGVRFTHRADEVARDRSEQNQDSVGKSLSINRHLREAGGAGVSSRCGASFVADASL